MKQNENFYYYYYLDVMYLSQVDEAHYELSTILNCFNICGGIKSIVKLTIRVEPISWRDNYNNITFIGFMFFCSFSCSGATSDGVIFHND